MEAQDYIIEQGGFEGVTNVRPGEGKDTDFSVEVARYADMSIYQSMDGKRYWYGTDGTTLCSHGYFHNLTDCLAAMGHPQSSTRKKIKDVELETVADDIAHILNRFVKRDRIRILKMAETKTRTFR